MVIGHGLRVRLEPRRGWGCPRRTPRPRGETSRPTAVSHVGLFASVQVVPPVCNRVL